MSSNREKFLSSVSNEKSNWREKAEWRRKNRDWLRKSQRIALKVLNALEKNGMTQKELAEKMEVSPQQISKIVKGSENLTLETIAKLERALGIVIFDMATNKEITSSLTFQNDTSWRDSGATPQLGASKTFKLTEAYASIHSLEAKLIA